MNKEIPLVSAPLGDKLIKMALAVEVQSHSVLHEKRQPRISSSSSSGRQPHSSNDYLHKKTQAHYVHAGSQCIVKMNERTRLFN